MFSPTCTFVDKLDEFIACLVLAVTFNAESIFLEQACEMQLKVACGAKEALACMQVCFDVFLIHGFQHVSEHHALCQADQNIGFFTISCILYFLASCGFCGAVNPVRRPSQESLHKECLQSMPMSLSMQLFLFEEQDYSQSLLCSAVVPFLMIYQT